MPARARVVAPRLRRVFNLQGSELVIILLLALVVLGPEKLPDAMRKLGNFYGQMKKMSTSFHTVGPAANTFSQSRRPSGPVSGRNTAGTAVTSTSS